MAETFPDGAVFVDLSPVHDRAGPDRGARPGARGARHRRRAPGRQGDDRVAEPPHPARSRQLRAGARGRARGDRAARRGPRRQRTRHQPVAAAGGRRAQLRPRAAPEPTPRRPCSSSARTRSVPTSRSPRRTRTMSPGSARPWTASLSRSSWPPRASGCSRPPSSHAGSTAAAAAGRRCARPPRAAADPAGDDRMEHTAPDAPERALLARLGVFEGGFALEAAESVAADTATVRVERRRHALLPRRARRQQPGPPARRPHESRFSMLATVREYAREQLEREGELHERRAAHAAYFVALGDRADPELEGGAQHDWVMRLGNDTGNLRAAVRTCSSSATGIAPPISPGACTSTGGSPACSAKCGGGWTRCSRAATS